MNKDALRNLDALIAEEVYQIEVFYDEGELFDTDCNTIPFWSTNMLCAWDLIKHLQRKECCHIVLEWNPMYKHWCFRLNIKSRNIFNETTADTAPLAICKSLLEIYAR